MIPGMNPRQLQQAMKKLGMKQEEIDATEVIIKTPDKDIIIPNPQVMKVNMMGQDSLQITGEMIEQEKLYRVYTEAEAGVPVKWFKIMRFVQSERLYVR